MTGLKNRTGPLKWGPVLFVGILFLIPDHHRRDGVDRGDGGCSTGIVDNVNPEDKAPKAWLPSRDRDVPLGHARRGVLRQIHRRHDRVRFDQFAVPRYIQHYFGAFNGFACVGDLRSDIGEGRITCIRCQGHGTGHRELDGLFLRFGDRNGRFSDRGSSSRLFIRELD